MLLARARGSIICTFLNWRLIKMLDTTTIFIVDYGEEFLSLKGFSPEKILSLYVCTVVYYSNALFFIL